MNEKARTKPVEAAPAPGWHSLTRDVGWCKDLSSPLVNTGQYAENIISPKPIILHDDC